MVNALVVTMKYDCLIQGLLLSIVLYVRTGLVLRGNILLVCSPKIEPDFKWIGYANVKIKVLTIQGSLYYKSRG